MNVPDHRKMALPASKWKLWFFFFFGRKQKLWVILRHHFHPLKHLNKYKYFPYIYLWVLHFHRRWKPFPLHVFSFGYTTHDQETMNQDGKRCHHMIPLSKMQQIMRWRLSSRGLTLWLHTNFLRSFLLRQRCGSFHCLIPFFSPFCSYIVCLSCFSDRFFCDLQVLEDCARFDMLLKLKRGSKEEKFKVEVHKNVEGTFHLNQMQQEHSETHNNWCVYICSKGLGLTV